MPSITRKFVWSGHSEVAERFRYNLKELMVERKMTQVELGRLTRLGHTYVNYVLKGKLTPGLAIVDRVAKVFGVPPLRLLEKIPSKSSVLP